MSKAQPLPADFGHCGVANFFYCPDPLLMTDEEVTAEYPDEQRRDFWNGVARSLTHTQHSTSFSDPAVVKAAANAPKTA